MNGFPPQAGARADVARPIPVPERVGVNLQAIARGSAAPAPARGTPQANHLLAALPPADRQRWWQRLEPVTMTAGAVLYEAGQDIAQVYFPAEAIVSLQGATRNGGSAEIAIVGRDGMVGVSLLMGERRSAQRVLVQGAGDAYRLDAHWLAREFERSDRIRQIFLRYTEALLTQMAQTVLCNRHHALAQQLCRRLLRSLDRVDSNQLSMTQESIAGLLGVRREGVTEAAGQLGDAGLIRYRRGRITVLDRSGLERRSCECYAIDRKTYRTLLPRVCEPACEPGCEPACTSGAFDPDPREATPYDPFGRVGQLHR